MIRKIDHLVITTADIAACVAFYQVLGFRSQEAAGRWELFAGDFKLNVHLIGQELEPKARHVQVGSADLCFEITGSLVDYRDFLLKSGLALASDIVTRHGVRGTMRSIYLRDPDENLIELCSYE